MALARDEHDITRISCLDGIAYGLGAIGHNDVAVLVSLHADEYLLDDGIGVFRARVVACHDGDVGGEGRGSHLGTLAMIAIATTTEDADDATLRDGTYGIDGLLDRVGRMRVVDEDTEIGNPAIRSHDALEPSGNLGSRLERRDDELVGETERDADAKGDERVLDVEATDERDGDVQPLPTCLEVDARRVSVETRFDEAHVAIGTRSDAVERASRIRAQLGHALASRRIRADHTGIGFALRKEAHLGREVLLHGLMVIEMVLREVAEGRDGEVAPPDTPKVECVTRDLACAHVDVGIDHARQQLLEIT